MQHNNSIHIGTSGWNYRHWRGTFYPEDMPQKKWLEYYVERFGTVEINNSFYQLPSEQTFKNWQETVPDDFLFSVKASRYITHMKKLKDPEQGLENFIPRVKSLGKKLGPILFQLPPHWSFNPERLQAFLQALPQDNKYTFEFRDPSWFESQTYEILAKHNAAFCIYEIKGELSPKEVTADFIYIRLHGPKQQAYTGQYDQKTLVGWAGAFSAWLKNNKEIYCYFDNDENGYAAQDALRLKQMVGN